MDALLQKRSKIKTLRRFDKKSFEKNEHSDGHSRNFVKPQGLKVPLFGNAL
jgi:hypothetical protein